jgi:hypothetical protein
MAVCDICLLAPTEDSNLGEMLKQYFLLILNGHHCFSDEKYRPIAELYNTVNLVYLVQTRLGSKNRHPYLK